MTRSLLLPDTELDNRLTFQDRLSNAQAALGSLCVGIDPHDELLEAWDLPSTAAGLREFAEICVNAFGGVVPCVKPQSAFFERFGSKGIRVLEDITRELRKSGSLVILDVKRGDIGSTMAGYANAYLEVDAPLEADAITLSSYLGVGALEPAFDTAGRTGKGLFVLALTSNKSAPDVQLAVSGKLTVADSVIEQVADRNVSFGTTGPFGIVVGATIGESSDSVRGFNGPMLAPGVGAQGGTAADVKRIFGDNLRNVVPSVSREVLRAGPDVESLRAAAERLTGEFAFLRG